MFGISSREAVNRASKVCDQGANLQEPVRIGAISYNYIDYGKYWALKSRTWSRKSMNFWASLPQRLLASVILDGEVKSDWTSERHSLDVISVERILVQNRLSEVSSSGWSTCRGRRGGVIAPGGPDSQGMLVAQGGTIPERLRARLIYL